MHFRITLDIPPSTNNAYKNIPRRGRVLTDDARSYKERAALLIRHAAARNAWRVQPGQRLALTLTLHFPNNRRRDIANCEKLPVDALSEALGFDDCLIDILTLRRGATDSERPRCEIFLHVANT